MNKYVVEVSSLEKEVAEIPIYNSEDKFYNKFVTSKTTYMPYPCIDKEEAEKVYSGLVQTQLNSHNRTCNKVTMYEYHFDDDTKEFKGRTLIKEAYPQLTVEDFAEVRWVATAIIIDGMFYNIYSIYNEEMVDEELRLEYYEVEDESIYITSVKVEELCGRNDVQILLAHGNFEV